MRFRNIPKVKYLVADGRYDYIETGSLISIHKNVKDILIPSEEEELLLHPLDFEEYGSKKYEVDFLIVVDGKVVPIEIKSGNRKTHPSLDYYCQTYKKRTGTGIVLTKGDLRITEEYRYIPLPMAWFLLES